MKPSETERNTGGGGGGSGTHISNDCLDGFLEHLAVAEQTKREGGVVQKLVRLAQVLLADELRPLEWLSAISAPHQVDRPLGAALQHAHHYWQQNILTTLHWGKKTKKTRSSTSQPGTRCQGTSCCSHKCTVLLIGGSQISHHLCTLGLGHGKKSLGLCLVPA